MGSKGEKDTPNINKIERVLHIYSRIMEGGIVRKSELAERFGVNERSIQRDIDDIRNYMQENLIQGGDQYSVEERLPLREDVFAETYQWRTVGS